MRKRGKRGLALLPALILLLGVTAAYAAGGTAPSAKITVFADGATNGLRASQLLEVETGGFTDNATLAYTYQNGSTARLHVFDSANMADAYSYIINAGGNWTGNGMPWFALDGKDAPAGTVTVTVKDVNPNSSTYGKIASASYNSFGKASLQDDVANVSGGVFASQSLDAKDFLAQSGVTHITCANALVSGASVSGRATLDGTIITGSAEGTATLELTVSKTAGCFFHPGQSATASLTVRVFKMPVIATGSTSVTLSELEAGVTYTINGQSYTYTADGGSHTWTGLRQDETYQVEASVTGDGKTYRAYTSAATRFSFYLSYNGVTPKAPLTSQTVTATAPVDLTAAAYTLTHDDYEFGGWYIDAACEKLPAGTATSSYRTYYAKWTAKTFTVQVTLSGTGEWNSKTVSLRQGSTEIATQSSGADGVYTFENVPTGSYQVYVNGERKTNVTVNTEAKAASDAVEATLYCFRPTVNLTKDGSGWGSQTVALRDGAGKILNLTDSGGSGTYSAQVIQAGSSFGTWEILVNGGAVDEEVSDGDALTKTVGFYTAAVGLTKDGSAWTDAAATLRDSAGRAYAMTYSAGKGYAATVYDNKTGYGVYVSGVTSGEDVGLSVDSRNSSSGLAAAFFTVTFDSNGGSGTTTQIIQSGKYAQKPSANPVRTGHSFLGWASANNATAPADIFLGQYTRDAITAATTWYAVWEAPSVVVGDYVRCDVEGNPGDTHYKVPNLTIRSFATVASANITVTNGTVDLLGNPTGGSAQKAGSGYLVTFAEGTSAEAAAAYLRENIVVKHGKTADSVLTVTAYGGTN